MFKFGDNIYTKDGKLGVVVEVDSCMLVYEVMFEDLDESVRFFHRELLKDKPEKRYYVIEENGKRINNGIEYSELDALEIALLWDKRNPGHSIYVIFLVHEKCGMVSKVTYACIYQGETYFK